MQFVILRQSTVHSVADNDGDPEKSILFACSEGHGLWQIKTDRGHDVDASVNNQTRVRGKIQFQIRNILM